MEIYVDNQQLHITKGDVSLNWANLRFDTAVADEWSTEIELPNVVFGEMQTFAITCEKFFTVFFTPVRNRF